jgi:hypothetical protein
VRRAWLTMLLVIALLLIACTGDDTAAEGNDAPPSDLDLTTFENDRLSFVYPAGWEIVERDDDGDERRALIEAPEGDEGQYPDGRIFVVWPIIPGDDLERAIGFFSPDPDQDEVTDLDQQDIEVPGATEAVLQTFVATDAVPDDDTPVGFWGLYAMADVGRTVLLLLGVPEDAPLDGQEVADAVLDSLVLLEPVE